MYISQWIEPEAYSSECKDCGKLNLFIESGRDGVCMIQFFRGQPVHICSQSLLFGSLICCRKGFFPSNIVICIAFRFPQLNWFFDLDILLYVFPLIFPCTYTSECFESW